MPYGEFNVTLNKLKIDRVTGDTTLTMSWFLVPALHIKHKCQISRQPDKDAAIMIGEAFEGMKAEIKGIGEARDRRGRKAFPPFSIFSIFAFL